MLHFICKNILTETETVKRNKQKIIKKLNTGLWVSVTENYYTTVSLQLKTLEDRGDTHQYPNSQC